MPADRKTVRALADQLRGKKTGVRYKDLAALLARAECVESGAGSSHRTWSHPAVRQHLTLQDKGSGDVLRVYISKTRKYLLEIAERL